MESLPLSSRVTNVAKALVGLFSATSATQAHGLLGGVLPGSNGEPPYRGASKILDAYSTMPWLRAVSQRVATAVATSCTQWRLYAPASNRRNTFHNIQRSGDATTRQTLIKQSNDLRPIDDHLLLTALNRANSYMVGESLFKVSQIHLDLIGETFWLKERNNFGAPVEFWPIPPDWVESTPTPARRSYKVSFRGWQGEIPDTEILWMADLNPANPYGRGSGLARSLSDELETDEYAAKHTRQLFFNRARPDMIIWPKQQGAHDVGLQQDQVRRLEERWLDGHQGFWRAFKPFFVGREINVHEVNQSLQELQLVELRKHERDTIVQTFGVPPELLGILTNSNRSTIESADYLFSRWVVSPRMEFLRAQLQERLIPEYDERLILDFVSPVQEDREHVLDAAKAAPWAMTVNEWRNLQDLDPLEGKDGTVHMMPLGIVPVATPSVQPVSPNVVSGNEPSPIEAPAPVTESVIEDIEILKDAGDIAGVELLVRELTDNFDDLHPLWQKLSKHELEAIRISVRLFDDLMNRADDDALIMMTSVPQFERIVRYQDWIDDFNAKWQPLHLKAFYLGAEFAAENAGLEIERSIDVTRKAPASINFNDVDPRALEWVKTNGAQDIEGIGATTKKGVQKSIHTAMKQGLDTDRTTQRLLKIKIGLTERQSDELERYKDELKAKYPDRTAAWREGKVKKLRKAKVRQRAKVIARTEMANAASSGKTELWNQAIKDGTMLPGLLQKAWSGVSDRRQCEICEDLDGDVVDFEKSFGYGLSSEPAHPNCRCVTTIQRKKVKT